MMVADGMAGHVTVAARRLRVIGVFDFWANLVNIKHFAGMDGAMVVGVRQRRHDDYAKKQPNQDQ